MTVHRKLKQALRRVIFVFLTDRGEHVQIHATGKRIFAGCNNNSLNSIVIQRLIEQIVEQDHAIARHHVHRLVFNVPSDDANAIGVNFQCKISHIIGSLHAFNDCGRTHAGCDAKRGKARAFAGPLKLVQQCADDNRTCGTQWMTHRN